MDYYRLLQLEREPFSNSPDPEYFFQSQQHRGCLQKLELALRLKRGLNVILGDVGTGKTTLCRELIRKLSGEEQFETHLILDPAAETPKAFLLAIADMLCPAPLDRRLSESEIKEQIKRILFEKGVSQGRTVILIIDEGQKIAPANVEILRELLNYETNDYKLLQIVIFAQQEFAGTLEHQANFADRVNLLYRLSPMNFKDSCRMIRHRLKLASGSPKPLNLFTRPGLWAIYLASRGYPRRIIHICHQSMLAMIIQNRTRAGWATIRSCKNRLTVRRKEKSGTLQWLIAGAAGTVIAGVVLLTPRGIHMPGDPQIAQVFKIAEDRVIAPPEIDAAGPQPAQSEATAVVEQDAGDSKHSQPQPDLIPQLPPASPAPATVQISQIDATIDETAPQEAAAPDPTPPASLGKLLVQPGDTIGALICQIYGAYRNQTMGAVLETNPQITKPNRIEPGDEIVFPALTFPVDAMALETHWIILDEADELSTASNMMRRYGRTIKSPLRLIPWWSPVHGLRFQVAVRGTFGNLEEAEQFLSGLPRETADNARIVSHWDKDAHLFSELNIGMRQ